MSRKIVVPNGLTMIDPRTIFIKIQEDMMLEILGFLLAGVPIYGFIILKREGKEISPNSKGGNAGQRIGGCIGHCTGEGMRAIAEKFSTNKNDE